MHRSISSNTLGFGFRKQIHRGLVSERLVSCPLLNVVSEREHAESASIRAWAERCEREIFHPDARLVVMPQDEGADSHVIGTNLSLMSQVVFDWLDATLARPERAADRSVQPPVRSERDRPVAERTCL